MRNIQDKKTNEVIHCETREEWNEISKLLGCIWGEKEWNNNKEKSCIRNSTSCTDRNYYIERNYTITPAKEFLNCSSEPLIFN